MQGFIAGTGDATIRLYERTADPKEVYKRTKRYSIADVASCISELALSPSEDVLICTTDSGQAFTLSLSNSEMLMVRAGACGLPA